MRQPIEIERLYLDFDGFFASVEQQAHPHLRGRPVGVVPFAGAEHTCVIACSREAKRFGVKNVMNIAQARNICPDIILVPQSPDLYRRAHNALLSEISAVIPIDAVKSIDELTCRVEASDRGAPQLLGRRIKRRIADHIGSLITCSIGFAANRQLAKMACKAGKPDGNMVWHPKDMPAPLLALKLADVPGIGVRMERRLATSGVTTIADLLATQPKQMGKLWGNVTGERLWYALHGYDVQTPASGRRHVRPRPRAAAGITARSITLKRLHGCCWSRPPGVCGERVGTLAASGSGSICGKGSWQRTAWLPAVHDDQAVLTALSRMWADARAGLSRFARVVRVACGAARPHARQTNDSSTSCSTMTIASARAGRARRRRSTRLNRRYGRTLVSVGPWAPPPGGYAGGKISYTRIPRAEDFW